MVKLTEVEDEHFTDKPIPTKGDALLVSDDEEDYTDTGKCLTNICHSSPSSPMQYHTGMSISTSIRKDSIRVDIPQNMCHKPDQP